MIDQKIHESTQTGWVKWDFARVTLESPRLLSCEASVTNVSKHNPVCVVYVKLGDSSGEQVVFKFWLGPEKSEIVKLERQLSRNHTRIAELIVDEE